MKKILLLPAVALLLVFALATPLFADDTEDNKTVLEGLVASIIDHYDDGLTQSEIVDVMLDDFNTIVSQQDDHEDEEVDDDNSDIKEKRLNFGQFKKSLRMGENSDDVMALQEALNTLAEQLELNFELTEDGIYGHNTAQAVRLFQIHQRLGVDGVVGPQTKAALQRFFNESSDETSDDDQNDE